MNKKAPLTKTEMRILLNDFFTVWEKYPHQRFGQLVVNLLGNDPFYVEDKETMRIINKTIMEGLHSNAHRTAYN